MSASSNVRLLAVLGTNQVVDDPITDMAYVAFRRCIACELWTVIGC